MSSVLHHYTNKIGLEGILRTSCIYASIKATNPRDARFGDGVYLTDISPGTITAAQLSRRLLGNPFKGRRFLYFVSIDTTFLTITTCREHVFLYVTSENLRIDGRTLAYGEVIPTSSLPGV